MSAAIEVSAARVKTRLGPVWVLATGAGIREVRLGARGRPSGRALKRDGMRLVWKRRWTDPARRLLERYFNGGPVALEVPLDLTRGTPFERRFRDIHTLSQQIQSRSAHFEAVGQILLGVPPEVFF